MHRLILAGVTLATAVAATAALASLPARATTGGDGLPPPKVKVDRSVGMHYLGRFYLAAVDRSARITSGVFDVAYTEGVAQSFMVGTAEIERYNDRGRLAILTAAMYPFSYRHGKLYCNLLVTGTTNDVLGRLVQEHITGRDTPAHPNHETITGKLTLGGKTYHVVLRQGQDTAPAQLKNLPKAKQIGSARPTRRPEAGRSARLPDPSLAGVYAPVVRLAGRLAS